MSAAERRVVRHELRWVVGSALAAALIVGGIADLVTASHTSEPYQLGGLIGGMLGLLIRSE